MDSVDVTPSPSPSLTIELNAQPFQAPLGSTLEDIVRAQGYAENAVATAVNHRFVARGLRSQTVLSAGDQVMFFQPIVGG